MVASRSPRLTRARIRSICCSAVAPRSAFTSWEVPTTALSRMTAKMKTASAASAKKTDMIPAARRTYMSGLTNWRRNISMTVGGRFAGRVFSPKISRRRTTSASDRPPSGDSSRPAASSAGTACHAVVRDSSGERGGTMPSPHRETPPSGSSRLRGSPGRGRRYHLQKICTGGVSSPAHK